MEEDPRVVKLLAEQYRHANTALEQEICTLLAQIESEEKEIGRLDQDLLETVKAMEQLEIQVLSLEGTISNLTNELTDRDNELVKLKESMELLENLVD